MDLSRRLEEITDLAIKIGAFLGVLGVFALATAPVFKLFSWVDKKIELGNRWWKFSLAYILLFFSLTVIGVWFSRVLETVKW